MFHTFILSNFNYCPIIWFFCGKTASKKVENIQERALHFMFNDEVSTYKSLLDRCGYTFQNIRTIKTTTNEVFRFVHDLNSTFMKEMFNTREISYDLRDKYIMHLPRFNKITYGKNTFKYYASHIWNSLPEGIKTCTSIDVFKSLLKTWEMLVTNVYCFMLNL